MRTESESRATADAQATLTRILSELDTSSTLPEGAIRDARLHRTEITPLLTEAIQSAARRAAAGDVPPGNAHFYALYLVGEFRAKSALPAVIEAISLPDELPFDLFDDAITESLPAILAALVDDAPEVLDSLIANQALNSYVRWEAASAYLYLVRDGRLTREVVVERLQHYLRKAISRKDEDIVTALVMELTRYAAAQTLEEVRESFRLGLVDECIVDLDYCEQQFLRGDAPFHEALAHCGVTGIEDTVETLRDWSSFQDERRDAPREYEEPSWQPECSPMDLPIRNSEPRIGRNEPCPCGSGKKFKRCCGAR
jgi:hypothetical protein